ncbi:Zn(II)2Cys6 transcription factor [Leptodontidium sp. MPI-SDFR-AT-0119]|nr:Zn(II)2Cys6 transcription factor [Leptodontidium sp. MPI-SDFR-AT-0119]
MSINPKKQRRITKACDYCSRRSIRCPPREGDTRCQNCVDFALDCTYDRPSKKRGIQSGSTNSPGKHGAPGRSHNGETGGSILFGMMNNDMSSASAFDVQSRIPEKWMSMVLGIEQKIQPLVEIYFEVVYPIFPFFHQPSMNQGMANRNYLTDLPFFAKIMAICALASARVRDGALSPGRFNSELYHTPSSESFFAAATGVLPQELGATRGLDWMCTCALLALYGIQVGKIDIMHQYLGLYHSLVSMDSLHDEKNWPKDIGFVETELRRRLFWSMYNLEVYSSIVWGSIIRCREAQCSVSFPSEVDDDLLSDSGFYQTDPFFNPYSPQPRHTDRPCWLRGWNFATQVYQTLEHAMDEYLRRRSTNPSLFSPSKLFHHDILHCAELLVGIMDKYEKLHSQFKEPAMMSAYGQGSQEYKVSFQAVNITATFELARLVLFACEDAGVEKKCGIVRDLLKNFDRTPTNFIRALSCPLLHHVASVGNILASVIEGPISESSYEHVRAVLLGMVKFLSRLEDCMTSHVGAAARVSKQISDIDEFMAMRREHGSSTNRATYRSVVASASSLEANYLNIDPELQNLMGPFTSEMQSSSLTATMDLFDGTHVENGLSDGYGDELQLSQESEQNFPDEEDMSQGSAANGVNGGSEIL